MPSVRDVRVQDRGSFFDDSFFKDSWNDFDTAMQRVLDRFDAHGMQINDKSRPQCQDVYRKIRSNKINDDMYASQAVQVTERDGRFQAVVDVKDFNPTDLQVKVVDEKVVLEGRYDKVSEDGKSSSSKAFYREFHLPVEADIDQISTALSKDGVLTIRAPRKEGMSPPSQRNNTAAASRCIQDALNERRFGNGMQQTPKNPKQPFMQNTTNIDYTEPYDGLPKDVKERLVLSDKDSGRSSGSGSPVPSMYTPSCESPSLSEAGSEASSRVSTSMEFDVGKRNPYAKSEVSFKVGAPNNAVYQNVNQGPPSTDRMGGSLQSPQMNVSSMQQPRSCAAVGSGGTASISVKEEDGKKTLTSEKSSLVQQKDGFLESKEVAAEVTEKNSQAARREATTRMMKTDEDPEGRFKKSEAADASDVSESCVQHLPDGSVVTVRKSSTSTSNVKQSVSTSSGGPLPGFFDSDFPMGGGLGNMGGLMGRGQSLMSQMSSDSLASNMSNFSDMSSFSRFSDMSNFSDMSTGFNNRSPFKDRFSNLPAFSNISSLNNQQTSDISDSHQMPSQQSSHTKKTFSSTSQSSSFSSSFDNMKF